MTIPRSRLKHLIPPKFKASVKHPAFREVDKVFPLALKQEKERKYPHYLGKVVRTDYPKSCVVQVENTEIHSEVLKIYQNKHWVHVHDPNESCYIGDEVLIGPRKCPPGIQYHGKPYQVTKHMTKSEGFTDHHTGKVWSREEKPSSYRFDDGGRPAYLDQYLPNSNKQTLKGKRAVLESTAYGKRPNQK